MKAIYPLIIEPDREEISLPKGAKILCVQVHLQKVCLWWLGDVAVDPVVRRLIWLSDAQPVIHQPGPYLGTVQLAEGVLVYHVFEGRS